MITRAQLREAWRRLGLSGRPVCVHSSLRSFGDRIEEGPTGVIDAALAEGSTLVVPTFTYECEVTPPVGEWVLHNGIGRDGTGEYEFGPSKRFSTHLADVSPALGALPAIVASHPSRIRGDHPLDSFSALGPCAQEIVGAQTPEDVYAPFRAIAQAGGFVLLMGVGLTRMTLIHMAEAAAGRALFRRWALQDGGETVRTRVGGCSEGFHSLEPALESLPRRKWVGASEWRAYPVGETLTAATDAIRSNPQMTHCGGDCPRCDDAVRGGPLPAGPSHS